MLTLTEEQIKKLPWYPHVARVLGNSTAVEEIAKVIYYVGGVNHIRDNPEGGFYKKEPSLHSAFAWDSSPQGYDFWFFVDLGKNPKYYGIV